MSADIRARPARRVVHPALLIPRLITHRRAAAVLLLLAGFIFTFVVVGVALTSRSADHAARSSVSADLGGRSYAISSRTDGGTALLEGDDRFVPIAEVDGAVVAGDARMPVVVRITPDAQPLPLGALVAGHHPTKSGEAAVSRSVARDLGIAVGDQVDVPGVPRPDGVLVTGVIADPANADAATVAVVGDVRKEDIVTWVSAIDPYTVPALHEMFDARVLTYQSSESMEAVRVQQLPDAVGLLRRLPAALGTVLAVLVGSIVMSMRRVAGRDRAALQAAGMSARRSYWTLLGTGVGLVLAGQLVGIFGAATVIWLARSPLSRQLGQDWVTLAFPWLVAAAAVAGLPAAAVLARPAARAFGRLAATYRGVTHRLVGAGVGIALGAVGLVLFAIAAVARTQTPPGQLVRLAPVGAVCGVAALAVLVRLVVTSRLTPGTKALVRVLTANVAVVAAVGGVVAVGGSAYAATATREANGFSTLTRAPQPRDSLLLTEVPTPAARKIVAMYEQLGGKDGRRYTLPDETSSQTRVTGTRLVQCMESADIKDPSRAPDDCFPQTTMAPVAIVAFSQGESAGDGRGDGSDDNVADPGLVEAGQVGLLTFDVGSPDARRVAITNAAPDDTLGGNMPGLVIPIEGKVARAFDLHPGKTELVALLGFGELPRAQQARLRSTMARVAPAAQIADATERQGYELNKSVATAVAIVGAALVALITLSGTAAVLTGHRRTRRNLVDGGAHRGQLRRVALLWSAALFATYVGSIALSWLAARVGGINIDASYGWTWVLPGVVGVLTTAVFFVGCIRVPDRTGE